MFQECPVKVAFEHSDVPSVRNVLVFALMKSNSLVEVQDSCSLLNSF